MKFIAFILGAFIILISLSSCSATKGMKTLEKLHGFTGNWEGTGKIYSAPNQEGKPWTSTVNYKGAYDDVLVQKKEIINTGAAQPIASLSFLGWDWENGNPVILSVGNDGKGGRKHAMSMIGDNKYQFTRTTKNDREQSVVDEVVTHFMGDTYTITSNRSIDGGTAFKSFEGNYTRIDRANNVDLFKVGALVPLSDDTKRIACMAGVYKQKGHFNEHPIDGDESIDLILGGHAMFINFKFKEEAGDGYFGSSLTSWNSDINRFSGFMISNDAMTATFEAWLSEDKSQLIYEPLDSKGRGLENERWSANLNLDENHCLLNVSSPKVGANDDADKGLYIKFTKVKE